MLHRLEIENFYSIRDLQVIDLRATGNTPDKPTRLAPAWRGAAERVPKVIAVVGANASGKSNVLKALSFLAWFIKDSFLAPPESRTPFEPFNDGEDRPTRFVVHASGSADPKRADAPDVPQCKYAYEVTFSNPKCCFVRRMAMAERRFTACATSRQFAGPTTFIVNTWTVCTGRCRTSDEAR